MEPAYLAGTLSSSVAFADSVQAVMLKSTRYVAVTLFARRMTEITFGAARTLGTRVTFFATAFACHRVALGTDRAERVTIAVLKLKRL